MAEKTFNEVPRVERELYGKGMAAVEKNNLDYALVIFNQVLVKEPGFYECREALRAAQMKKAGAGGGFFKKMLGTAGSSPALAKAQLQLRSNPVEALANIEQVLNGDPNNVIAQKAMAEAALAAGLPKTAVLSLEIARKNAPKDQEIARSLAEALAAMGNINRAMSIFEELVRLNPLDQELAMAHKNLTASQTMVEGGYDAIASGNASYRDILRNKEEAVSLEQQHRGVKTDDVAAQLIAEYEARLLQEPNNWKVMRSMADLYTQRKEFDRALECYQRIIEVEGAVDASLEKAMTETIARKFDHQAGQLDASVPEQAAEIARLEKEKKEYLLTDCKRRMDKYPNDLLLRYELGVLYFKADRIGEAIQELQKAQANPNRKIPAMSCLGQCFAKRNMNDLAARTFQNALKEKVGFDEEKKELLHSLGVVLEKMGKREEAIEQFKQIYEIDIGYRDVAARVDAYYAGS